MAAFTDADVDLVLTDLQRNYPGSTADDARTILMDAAWAEEDERAYVAADDARVNAELEFMAVQA